jgi:hypothetical protein
MDNDDREHASMPAPKPHSPQAWRTMVSVVGVALQTSDSLEAGERANLTRR